MTSSNINKIVQSNFNLKPWILSKNTNEIVSTCIQNIYKQLPNSFRRDFKTVKVAAVRPENMGPLRAFKNQERHMRSTKITPRQFSAKKSSKTNARSSDNNLVKNLKASNRNNLQLAQQLAGVTGATPGKKLLKSPNYKIYKSRRFGSSASSSRSSLFRRYDERRLQRQHYQPQVNYLVRSFHTSQFEGTYAKFLMPVRNQRAGSRLGSLLEAVRISTAIQQDLMPIDIHTRELISLAAKNKKSHPPSSKKIDHLNVWKHPPSIELFLKERSNDSNRDLTNLTKNVKVTHKQSRLLKLSPDLRVHRPSSLKHPMPNNEFLSAKHDGSRQELNEKHRRRHMKKLGLIEQTPSISTTTEIEDSPEEAATRTRQQQLQSSTVSAAAAVLENLTQSNINYNKYSFPSKRSPHILSHLEANKILQNIAKGKSSSIKYKSPLRLSKTMAPHSEVIEQSQLKSSHEFPIMNSKTNLTATLNLTENSDDSPLCQEVFKPLPYSSTGPTAAARTHLLSNSNNNANRPNRSDFFRPTKY